MLLHWKKSSQRLETRMFTWYAIKSLLCRLQLIANKKCDTLTSLNLSCNSSASSESPSAHDSRQTSPEFVGAGVGRLSSPRIISSAKHDRRQTAGSPASARAVTPYSVCTSVGVEEQLIEQSKGRSNFCKFKIAFELMFVFFLCRFNFWNIK